MSILETKILILSSGYFGENSRGHFPPLFHLSFWNIIHIMFQMMNDNNKKQLFTGRVHKA